MNDIFSRLAARISPHADVILPRTPSLFEPHGAPVLPRTQPFAAATFEQDEADADSSESLPASRRPAAARPYLQDGTDKPPRAAPVTLDASTPVRHTVSAAPPPASGETQIPARSGPALGNSAPAPVRPGFQQTLRHAVADPAPGNGEPPVKSAAARSPTRTAAMEDQPPADRPATRQSAAAPVTAQGLPTELLARLTNSMSRTQARAGASPRSAAASRPEVADPVIQVSIGRIEIHATTARQTAAKEAPATPPVMSLDEYLRQRRSGAGRQ